jgi:hypothetical protein
MTLGATALGLALWGTLLLGLQACGSSSSNGAPAGADAQADTAASATPCAECNLAATSFGGDCYNEAAACNASAACTALATCISTCNQGDSSCVDTCVSVNPGAVSGYNAVGNCLCNTSCASTCGASCVGATDAGFDAGFDTGTMTTGDGGDPCTTCQTAALSSGGACFEEVSTCMTDTSCSALVSCLGQCAVGDATCENQCGSTDSAGVSDYEAVGNCLCGAACGAACASSCTGGADGG